jgi:hypothetical protein
VFIALSSKDYRFVTNYFESFTYSWQGGLGDFDYALLDSADNPHRYIAWSLLLGSLVLNMVVMFNLLISIITETANTVKRFAIEY